MSLIVTVDCYKYSGDLLIDLYIYLLDVKPY